MPRPKVKGEALTIRLSLEAHAEAERRAAKAELPVRVWVEQQLDRALAPTIATTPSVPVKRDGHSQVTPLPKTSKPKT